MSVLLNLTEATIHQYASQESIQWRRDYYEVGAVLSATKRGDQLLVTVQGWDYPPP